MKNFLLAGILLAGIAATAQERPEVKGSSDKAKFEQMSPKQRADLSLKEMTLKLDLTESQQKEFAKIISEKQATFEKRKAERKEAKTTRATMTPEQRYEMKSKMLDEKIAMKARVKAILNEKQFEKWEKIQHGRKMKSSKAFKDHRQKDKKVIERK